MTKPIFDTEIHQARAQRPAPVSEWLRVCRMQTSLKKAKLKEDRIYGMYNRARKDSRKRMLEKALHEAANASTEIYHKAIRIMEKAFEGWEAEVIVSYIGDTCHVTLYWDWPAQQRTIIFSFADPLTVREE